MLSSGEINFILKSPGAEILSIGPLTIRWYGLLIALGFFVSYLIAERLVLRQKLSLIHFSNQVFFSLFVGILFARLYFVVFNWSYFSHNLSEIPMIWHGGQSIHGALIGGTLSLIAYSKFKKINFYQYADIFAVVLPLGQSIGRWGNFFNNEAFGKPTTGFLKLYISPETRPINFFESEYFHPTFLYESALDLFLFFYLLRVFLSGEHKNGYVFWMYLFLYSIVRFFIEYLRVDSLLIFNSFPVAQFISMVLLVVSFIMIKPLSRK